MAAARLQVHDAAGDFDALVHQFCHRGIAGAGHVAEHFAVPFDADGVGVMRIVGVAHQGQGIAHFQAFPQALAGIVLEAGDGLRAPHHARGNFRPCRWQGH